MNPKEQFIKKHFVIEQENYIETILCFEGTQQNLDKLWDDNVFELWYRVIELDELKHRLQELETGLAVKETDLKVLFERWKSIIREKYTIIISTLEHFGESLTLDYEY